MLKILVVSKSVNALPEDLGRHEVERFREGSLFTAVRQNGYHIVILADGGELIRLVKEADPRAEVFVITKDMDEVEAVKHGASACFSEPLDARKLRHSVDCVSEVVQTKRQTAELEKQLHEKYTFAGVIGKNPKMLEIFNFLRRIAPYYKTVTILGETGSGKEEIAKALHSISPSAKNPFITCNCGALVETLIESELFGHTKGAFTGAHSDKAGIFEAAGEGTVFLDEIGDLPLSFQPHLLRVLQNGDFRRLGSNRIFTAKCRIITATNKDLAREAEAGRFREDLYFRLMPLKISVPPLRDRKDDIPLLCRHILDRFRQRTGKTIKGISIQAQAVLMSYDWPGNVRELENVLEHVAILLNGSFIAFDDLPSWIREAKKAAHHPASSLDDVVKAHIEKVMAQCSGNKSQAAQALGISRRALFRKLEKFSIPGGIESAESIPVEPKTPALKADAVKTTNP